MKLLMVIFSLFVASHTWAQTNQEITGKYLKDNANYIYLVTDTHKIKLKKKELTKEGVKQILANKEKPLTLFVPKKAIVGEPTPLPKKEEPEI